MLKIIFWQIVDDFGIKITFLQHARAHGEPAATQNSFYDVITTGDRGLKEKSLMALKNRCLSPGYYSQHLDKWLDFYPSKNLLLLDGERLRSSPAEVMGQVQEFLQLQPILNYSSLLK